MWILGHYDNNLLSWVPNPNRSYQRERFDGLTAQVLFVLLRAESEFKFLVNDHIYLKIKRDFLKNRELTKRSLFTNDRLHDSDTYFRPTRYQAETTTFLWLPWSVLTLKHLSNDANLLENERRVSTKMMREILNANADAVGKFMESEFTYMLAEHLFCLSVSIG
jgi:hypothetical protein